MTIEKATALAKNLIARWEGLRLDVYKDSVGNWTIGYGHLIKDGESYHPYGPITTITREEADALLLADMQTAENCVSRNVRVAITDEQRAALVSFAFNVGCGNFQNSRMLQFINAGQLTEAANEFSKWVYATEKTTGEKIYLPGLASRRASERQLFTA